MITRSMLALRREYKTKKFIQIERDMFWFVTGAVANGVLIKILILIGWIKFDN
jgi:hypothetical protein